MKKSRCVFFILSAYSEITGKVIKRVRGKYLSIFGEYAESISAYIENIANWGYLRNRKWSPNTRRVFKRIRRVGGKNLCVHGEDAKRLLAYSPNTPKDIKVCISRLIIIRIKNILDSFHINYMGWFKPKKPSHANVPLKLSEHLLKGIVQPFELGGETRLIRSAVK